MALFCSAGFREEGAKKKEEDEKERQSDRGNLDAGEDGENHLRHRSEACVHEPYSRESEVHIHSVASREMPMAEQHQPDDSHSIDRKVKALSVLPQTV